MSCHDLGWQAATRAFILAALGGSSGLALRALVALPGAWSR